MLIFWCLTLLAVAAVAVLLKTRAGERRLEGGPRFILRARFLEGKLSEADLEELLEQLDS